MTRRPLQLTVEAEETIYASRYSNNGASPLWCFNNTCLVRQGEELFISGYERIPGAPPLNATLRDGTLLSRRTLVRAGEGADPALPTDRDQVGRPYVLLNGERILGDAIPTPRFHLTPDGRRFVVYYVTGGRLTVFSPCGLVDLPPGGHERPAPAHLPCCQL
jgi:hypothetical protein